MSASSTSIASVLNSLIQICQDGAEGFRCAADNVKTSDFKSLFSELSLQRQEFTGELQALVRHAGEDAETAGTVSGALHRGWLDLKAAITRGEEHPILVECERGEDATVAAYHEAIEHGDLPIEVRAVVRQQFMGVQIAHDRVRDLRDRFS